MLSTKLSTHFVESCRARANHYTCGRQRRGVFACSRSYGRSAGRFGRSIIASIVALTLIIERSVALRRVKIIPDGLLPDVLSVLARKQVNSTVINRLERNSPLGRVLASALRNASAPRAIAGAAVANTGGHVAHDLSRYLSWLGSIGSIAPLLGLLGTVIGMIEIFASQQSGSSPQQLAHGISIALYCTAFGIIVAVPSVLAYRHFKSKVETYVVNMEDQSQQLLEAIFTERYDLEPR